MFGGKDKEKNTKPFVLFAVVLLILFAAVVIVYSFFSWDQNKKPPNPNGTITPPPVHTGPNTTEVPLNETNGTKPNGSDPFGDLWFCGNGVPDPNEDCFSCPEDLPDECTCLSPKKTVRAVLGEEFYLCHGQKAIVDNMEISFSDRVKPSFRIVFSDGRSMQLIPEKDVPLEFFDLSNQFDYLFYFKENVFHGVRLIIDYPKASLGQKFDISSGETVRVDENIFIKVVSEDPDDVNSPITVLFEDNLTKDSQEMIPGENASFNGFTVECVVNPEEGLSCEVFEGSGSE